MPFATEREPMNGTKSDRRQTRRLDIRIPLHIRVRGSVGADWAAESVDLSERGVLLRTELDIEVGTELELELEIPEQNTGMTKIGWRCMGRVVHVNRDIRSKQCVAAGVYFSRLQILRPSKSC